MIDFPLGKKIIQPRVDNVLLKNKTEITEEWK